MPKSLPGNNCAEALEGILVAHTEADPRPGTDHIEKSVPCEGKNVFLWQ